ncbi:hypothetical protein [Kribbella sp. NPDC006257]|uniref:hypothetical protein n=1 Tax=Kribbella sp. NPDC006257 TaxID=3156738 RepID=UPI0033B7FC9E
MGAVLWIPLMIVVLLAVGYLLWTLFAVGWGASGAAKSATEPGSGETAPHTTEHTKIRDIDTDPPADSRP